MNHHYPDNYHGYGHNTPSMPSMGYSGGYGDPTAMARMVHPREGYQMSHYQMMQQSGGMYSQGGFVGQQSSHPYNMGGFGNYNMPGMNPSMVMGNRQGDSRMSGGNMNPYYNPGMPPEAHSSSHGGMGGQPSPYSHNQANPHMQQPHLGMMPNQGHHAMSGQPTVTGQHPTHGQGGQISHSSSHGLSQATPQSTGTYGSQSSPLMMPRAHHVPQHPMRHPTAQQNPQEVADNILQMASSYPSNQTVQVPLKSRPAPYHIPRSPHYSVSHSDHPHTSPNPHIQPSPVASCQASPSPSSSSVKSPTPVLAPIPNPIPSPGISGLRSPCNQGMSPCGTQRSPAHMGSTYSGHSQGGPPTQCGNDGLALHHGMSPAEAQHYSPCNMVQSHNFSPFTCSSSIQRSSSMYSPTCDQNSLSQPDIHQSCYSSPASSSPCSNMSTFTGTPKHVTQSSNSNLPVSSLHMGNNPLMSLQKLVMLPETQVVDPKSVVNDTCLSSNQDENSKNVNGPAERFAESSSHSVGFQGHSSSPRSHLQMNNTFQVQNNYMANSVQSNMICASQSISPIQKQSPSFSDSNNRNKEQSPKQIVPNQDDNCKQLSNYEYKSQWDVDKDMHPSVLNNSVETFESVTNGRSSEHKLENTDTNRDVNIKHNQASENTAIGMDNSCVEQYDSEKNTIKPSPSIILPKFGEGDGPTDLKAMIGGKLEKTLENIGQPLVSLERKNGKVKDDTKCLIVQCHSPNVLLEMPVSSNDLSSTDCGNEDIIEQDLGNGIHTRIQNAFNSLVKAKLASVKKVSQFACVTPCSIAVGADERAACDRFAYRRNGFCRTLRTSRILCNGRNRNDSTGNGDSDESLENISENSFGLSESPQDGNRKRPSNAARRSDHKKPNLNSISATSKGATSDSKPSQPVASSGNGCASHGNDIVSDDDMYYYEGVDSSDIFINNCSSDESVASSSEVKQSNNSAAADTTNEKQDSLLLTCDSIIDVPEEDEEKGDKTDSESPNASFDKNEIVSIPVVSTPPSKRLPRSSIHESAEKNDTFSMSRKILGKIKEIDSVIDLTNENTEEDTFISYKKADPVKPDLAVKQFKEQNRSCHKFRPIILGHRSSVKYPVVMLEKSLAHSTQNSAIKQEKNDVSDAVDNSSRLVDSNNAHVKHNNLTADVINKYETQFKLENIDLGVAFHSGIDGLVKLDPEAEVDLKDSKLSCPAVSFSHKRKVRKKKPLKRKTVKGHLKNKGPEKVSKDVELRDSFKSMKFSRTLDLMKSQRKREQTSLGPFIRVVGKSSAPDSVTVFTQPIHEASLGLASGKHKQSKSRHTHPSSTATTTHMVTNLPTDKAALVSSSRTISNDPWVCVFCANHSSYRFLGDLFGPYYKEVDIARVEIISAEESKKGESLKDQKSSDSPTPKRVKEAFPNGRKSRRGRSLLQSRSNEPDSPPPDEVWIHESCVMWSPGVYLIGNKLYGLDEAIRDAAETVCSACKLKGAMIGCLHKGCSMKYHFVCAIDKECYMDEEKLSLLCPKHKGKRLKNAAESTRS